MTENERTRATTWLRQMRGKTPQDRLVLDITATTGWSITRDRYSKYESGSLPFGDAVLQHFIDYWTIKTGTPTGPEELPPEPPSLEERAVVAAERQAAALEQLVAWLTRPSTPDAASPAWTEALRVAIESQMPPLPSETQRPARRAAG